MTELETACLEIAQGSRILAMEGILDAFGHVSCRTPGSDNTFLMSRSQAPGVVDPEDVIELDFDGVAVNEPDAKVFLERFIHAEIYRARPDVGGIVHSHAAEVLPFTIVPEARVRPVCHVSGFLRNTDAPFDLAKHAGDGTDMLIRDGDLGAHFAEHLGDCCVGLMRAHGFTVATATLKEAVFNAVYTARNCRIHLEATKLGTPSFLSDAEAEACDVTTSAAGVPRAWDLWVRQLDLLPSAK